MMHGGYLILRQRTRRAPSCPIDAVMSIAFVPSGPVPQVNIWIESQPTFNYFLYIFTNLPGTQYGFM